jgi:glyoxylase-like metal-dependent hydrolase (beta-lactamase superfamily II)/rhodanese-related sulfurtransferase
LFFRQVLYRDLGCASYVLGDGGEAVVVDPRWDVEVYLGIARDERLRITHVVDTHDHADHVSGRARLAQLTGARTYRAASAGDEHLDAIRPGQEIALGALRLRALGVPGHRPEHLAFAVSDLTRGPDPWLVLTGDSLLVGDLARPDLVLNAEAGAAELYSSLESLLALGDHVEVWPAHVGGSLCGGDGLSGKTSSTIGFERRHNPLLQMERAEFVRGLVASIPTRPPNVDRIVTLNRASSGEQPSDPPLLKGDRLAELLRAGALVLDSRLPPAFDAGHLAGAVNLPVMSAGVGTRAGWALEPQEPIVLVAEDPDAAHAMASALHAVGLWQTTGYVLGDSWAWERQGLPVAEAHWWDLEQLAGGLRTDSVDLVDVRDTREWVEGHVPGSHHVPLDRLRHGRSVDLPDRGLTTAVACTAGIRAAFAASLLRRAGRRDVVRIAGGGVGDLSALGIGLAVGA